MYAYLLPVVDNLVQHEKEFNNCKHISTNDSGRFAMP